MIKIGNTVRDIVTGIQGIAAARVEFVSGNIQFTVQPVSKDNAYVEALAHDEQQLDFVDDGVAARSTPAPTSTGITLGEKVKDMVTGLVGIAVRKTTFLNGCVYYAVQGEVDDKNVAREEFFEYSRLEVVGKGVVARVLERISAHSATGKKSPGGPSTRLMARG